MGLLIARQTGLIPNGLSVTANSLSSARNKSIAVSELSTKDVVLDFAALASLIAVRRCDPPTILDGVRFGQAEAAEWEICSSLF